ncbi:hypothetical protein THRCLA_02797 [Thraustotheca clavata]|uniref:Uncharacterized protein n=1 Tax=Thraustotheca clavata TaxID=74557 RepID=A0A1W0A494_9STRA|nr:hypothetical protein THRCLA_02797 [Thraustotheca clavata]
MSSKRSYPIQSRQELEAKIVEANKELTLSKREIKSLEAGVLKLQEKLRVQQGLVSKKQYEHDDLEIQRDSLVQRLNKLLEYAEDVSGNTLAIDIDAPVEKKVKRTKSPRVETYIELDQDSPPRKREKKRKMNAIVAPAIPSPIQEEEKAPTPAVEFADHFWATTETAKLLSQPRNILVADGCPRKMRCSAFHPTQNDIFSTFSDCGTLMLWKFQPHFRDLRHVLKVSPQVFRQVGQACVEAFSWFSQGDKLALGFRDHIDNYGEICVVEWDSGFENPPNRVWNRKSSLMSKYDKILAFIYLLDCIRGVTCIEWYNDNLLVAGGANHSVVLWKYTDAAPSAANMRTLHSEHKSEIRSICLHDYSQSIFSGASDGLVVKYDLHEQVASTIIDRRQINNIPKINSVLPHPNNPHLLMVSCVHPTNQTLLLHDLRVHNNTNMPSMVWYKSQSDTRSMTQTITPRWSSAGMHVSCGSINGEVHLWDVRACKRKMNTPHQSIRLHKKTVLHANWHAQHNVLMSISNDRNIGVITFQ